MNYKIQQIFPPVFLLYTFSAVLDECLSLFLGLGNWLSVALAARWLDKMTSRAHFQAWPFCNSMNNLDMFIVLANDFRKTSIPLLF